MRRAAPCAVRWVGPRARPRPRSGSLRRSGLASGAWRGQATSRPRRRSVVTISGAGRGGWSVRAARGRLASGPWKESDSRRDGVCPQDAQDCCCSSARGAHGGCLLRAGTSAPIRLQACARACASLRARASQARALADPKLERGISRLQTPTLRGASVRQAASGRQSLFPARQSCVRDTDFACTRACVRACAQAHAHARACMHARTHQNTQSNTCARARTHTHTHTHIHRHLLSLHGGAPSVHRRKLEDEP